jgi:DNA-binding NarL/FixJ family response regulator|tara:strand:- start:330 stop:1238 length:909 start_codon:yes stop_codon:yes gene_type:complete
MKSNSKCSGVVLIVDDNPETISMLNTTLSEVGLTVLVALSGQQALTIAKRIKPEIILMDAMMPEMDGFEVCRLIKGDALISHIPVIFMTGLNASEDIVRGFDAGGIDYVTKPIDVQGLVARIGAQLTNSRIANGARQALDTLGQYSLSVELSGKILWSTPNTHSLMNSSGANPDWIANTLPAHLQPWLAEGAKQPLRLDDLTQPLLVTALESQDGDERLLVIELANKPNEADLLRDKFGLTAREAEVLTWISKGKTNHEIAIILDFSPRTANKHLEQIFRKLNVENRTTAAAVSLRYLSQIR